jgi:hypothetical protein
MSFIQPKPLPKTIQQALNQIAHSRALLFQASCRERIRHEIDEMLAKGMTHQQAIDALRANPPTVDPQY